MQVHHSRLRRLVVLAGTAALTIAMTAIAPVAAADPPVASRGPAAASARVDARTAAKAAVSMERRTANLPDLPDPASGVRYRTPSPTRTSPTTALGIMTPKSLGAFSGISRTGDGLDLEPPDPWIAASATYVVQSTNGLVRMYDRSGNTLLSLPTWALFATSLDEVDADPRIIWDAAHNRWVGVLLSFITDGFGGLTAGYLNIAVSDGSDPRAGWNVYSYEYLDPESNPTLPDYPGIASSGDKIVVTANEFSSLTDPDGYVGASILVLAWSDILAGIVPDPRGWTLADPTMFTIRPALLQSAASDVHLIAEGMGGEVLYSKITGSRSLAAWQDLSGQFPAFCDFANDPRQPGSPATITRGVDERPTDAVWRAGTLAWVSTCSDGTNLAVRVSQLNTATMTAVDDDLFGGGDGIDAYHGGIGFSGDGTLFAVYTQSSAAVPEFPSSYAAAYQGGSFGPSIVVKAGEGTYLGSRWGDYVGIAPDPAGMQAVWQANQYASADGTWATRVSRIALDGTEPMVKEPNQGLIRGTTLGSISSAFGPRVPVLISWSVTETGTGIGRTSIRLDQWGAGLAPSGDVSGTSIVRTHWWETAGDPANTSYRYGVTATDGAGNTSAEAIGPALTPSVYQQTTGVTYTGSWASQSGSSFSGRSVRYSSSAGATATFKTSGRAFGFVTTRASTRGKVKIFVDGVSKGTFTLKQATTKYRNLAYVVNFASSGTHTIKLVVVSGRVDVDAFVVLK